PRDEQRRLGTVDQMRRALEQWTASVQVPDVADRLVGADRVELVAQTVERAGDARAIAVDELLGVDRNVALGAPAAVGREDHVLLLQPAEPLVDFRARHARAAGELVAARRMPLDERDVELGLVVAESDLAQPVEQGAHAAIHYPRSE